MTAMEMIVSKSQTPPLGATEKMIIQLLQEDGRMATVEIARRLGISEPTVRKKLSQLLSDGTVSVRALANPADLGYEVSSFIGIATEWALLSSVAKSLRRFPFVENVSVTTGTYHIMLKANFETLSHMNDFLLKTLPEIEGIRDTYSFIILQNVKNTVLPLLESELPGPSGKE
ncbi:transcriptional regulator [Shinella sp. DD12]|nr:transcriptional regulator [Shinella sp. DD12]